MTLMLTALAGVLVVEGLVLALAPSRLEQMLAALATLSVEQRRMIGLGGLACGVVLFWIAKGLG